MSLEKVDRCKMLKIGFTPNNFFMQPTIVSDLEQIHNLAKKYNKLFAYFFLSFALEKLSWSKNGKKADIIHTGGGTVG